jgi:repressor LexA
MTGRTLTKKQKSVFEFIKEYIGKNQIAPYIREIQEACSITSYKSAVDKLLALEKKGYIKREINKHRSIQIMEQIEQPEPVVNQLESVS